jgi:hypothetical protein
MVARTSYRATSPTYSDALSHRYNFQPNYYRSASVGTADSSPVSTFPRPAGMPGYFPHMNSSMASFARFPSPVMQGPYYGYRRSPFLRGRAHPFLCQSGKCRDPLQALQCHNTMAILSHASLAEPINSTRLSVQIPRVSAQAPRLAPPDLAPSLSSLNLDMSVRYPGYDRKRQASRSFFSDDSSAVQKQRGSLRNRFHLHSLRSVLPTLPKGSMAIDDVDVTPRSKVTKAHQSR